MEALREPVDELEMIVDKEMWPMHLMEILYLKYKCCKNIKKNAIIKGS